MDKDNGTINTRFTVVYVQGLGDGGERVTLIPKNDATGADFKATGSIDLTFTDKAFVGRYKSGDAFNIALSPTADVTNRQRSANAADHISTR